MVVFQAMVFGQNLGLGQGIDGMGRLRARHRRTAHGAAGRDDEAGVGEKTARDALFIDVNHEAARGLLLDALKAQKKDLLKEEI